MESMAAIPRSSSDNATTHEGSNAAGSPSPEREGSPSNAAINIWSSEEAPKENAWWILSSRGSSALCWQLHRLRSAWGVRNSTWGSPHRDPQISSDSTRRSTALSAGTNAGSWQRDSAIFNIVVFYATPRWSSPYKENMNHLRKLPQRAECPNMWGSYRVLPEAPGNNHTQKRTGDKTSLKDATTCVALLEKCSLNTEAHRGTGHRTFLVWLFTRRTIFPFFPWDSDHCY